VNPRPSLLSVTFWLAALFPFFSPLSPPILDFPFVAVSRRLYSSNKEVVRFFFSSRPFDVHPPPPRLECFCT